MRFVINSIVGQQSLNRPANPDTGSGDIRIMSVTSKRSGYRRIGLHPNNARNNAADAAGSGGIRAKSLELIA